MIRYVLALPFALAVDWIICRHWNAGDPVIVAAIKRALR